MGTRGLVIVRDEHGNDLVTIYRQCDCYPNGLGKDLKAFLKPMRLVSGFTLGADEKQVNGMDDLAAMIVWHLKTLTSEALERQLKERDVPHPDWPVGGVYLMPAGTRDVDEEYVYTLYPKSTGKNGNATHIRIETADGKELFDGTPRQMNFERIAKAEAKAA